MLAVVLWAGCATGQTGPPRLVSHNSAELTGLVGTDSPGQVEYWFEYGTTTAYGAETQHETANLEPNALRNVAATIDGLPRSTTYHYRLCAQDDSQQGGPGCGEDRTVKTQSFACGETVTADVRFTGTVWCRDLPVGTDGLVIGASGIEIDLHGFSLHGPDGEAGSAIDNSGGFDNVTIRGIDNVGMYSGSTLNGFGNGVHVEDATGTRILYVRTTVDITGGSATEVRHSWISGGLGLRAQDTTGLVVADNLAHFGAMELSGVLDSRIVRNSMRPPSWFFCCSQAIRVAGNRNVIKDNTVSGWAGGLVLLSGADNKLLDNEVFASHLPDPNGTDSDGDGIFVGAFTAGTIVRGNQTHDNEGDGIEVQGTETRIAGNTADDNGDFGIDAVAGVIDGGGNTASGNGNPLQCRNVFCQ